MLSISRVFVLALAAVSVAADYNTVLTDAKNLDSITQQLTSATNAYTGTGAQAVALYNLNKKLTTGLDKTTNDTKASTVPTAAQGTIVFNYFNSTLYNDTILASIATINKVGVFKDAGILSDVINAEKKTRSQVAALADALIAKAPTATLKSQGSATKKRYDTAFSQVIFILESNQ